MNDEDFIKSLGGQIQAPSNSDEDFIKSLGGTVHAPQESHPVKDWVKEYITGGWEPEDTTGAGVGGYIKAGAATLAGLPASLLDMYRQAAYGDRSGMIANRVQQDIMGIGGPASEGAQAALRNINTPLSAIDPYMAMGGVPRAPKIPRAREIPPAIDPAIAKEVESFGGKIMENQSPMTGAAGAFDNIRRQTSGEIQPSSDIINTPMERMTDTILNGRDQAAVQGAEQGNVYAGDINFWKQRADQLEAQARENPEAVPPNTIHVNDVGTAGDPRTMEALARSTEGITYENVPPGGTIPRDNPATGVTVPKNVPERWAVDENGIPVRQGMPRELSDVIGEQYGLPIQEMSNETPHANELGNAIQEANGPKLGPDETYGSGPMTSSPEFNNTILKGPGRGQRGSTNFFGGVDALVRVLKATGSLIDHAASSFQEVARTPLRALVKNLPEDHMMSLPGMKDLVYKPAAGAEWVRQALAEGINKVNFMKNWQSGAIMAGEKYKSAVLQGVGQWLQWVNRRTDYDIRNAVKPVEKKFTSLAREDFRALYQIMKEESRTGTRISIESLSPRQKEAYTALRDALDSAWEKSSKTRAALGLDPVPKETAYSAAMRYGDWKQSFYDKSGRLVAHVASTTRRQAGKAMQYYMKEHPDWDWEASGKPEFAPELSDVGVPRDVISAWTKMQEWFGPNDPTAKAIGEAVSQYNTEHGYNTKGHSQRFLEKNHIPGFEGDKPWLSEAENAQAFFENQMKYLKDSSRWNNVQEALVHLNEIVKNEELAKNQPNIISYARKLIAKEMGVSPNIWKRPEAELAKLLGISRSSLAHRVGDLKTATYLQMLGFNPGYMLATPLQGMIGVAMHRYLTTNGFQHNVARTIGKTMMDTGAALMRHYMHEMSGKNLPVPMSDLGKQALMWAEDNGLVSKNLTDEFQHLGASKFMGAIKSAVNPTIMTPEKVGRLSVFMSMVHHLADARNGLSKEQIFQMAGDYTNHVMTDMTSPARPMIVDKMGAMGETAYVFHSYLFNAAHQMHLFGKEAAKGSPSSLGAYLGTTAAMGGLLALPFVNELDGLWNLTKEAIAKWFPQYYSYVSGLGIKGNILKNLGTAAATGLVSEQLGAQMSTRLGPQFVDPEKPLSGLAAPIQEAKEQMATLHMMIDPTKRNLMQAIYVNAPPWLKGILATHSDLFKNEYNPETNTQSYRKETNINDVGTDYKRTAKDESYRNFGLVSNEEYKTKALRYINNKEQERVMEAFQNNYDKAATRIFDGDKEGAKKYITAAMKLIPDEAALNRMLTESVTKYGMTPEERDKVHAESLPILMKLKRMQNDTNQ